MLLLIAGLAFVAGTLLTLVLGGWPTAEREAAPSLADAVLEGSWRVRLLTPALTNLARLGLRLTPAGASERLRVALAQAGNPIGAGEFVIVRVLSVAACLGSGVMLCELAPSPLPRPLCLGLSLLVGLAAPSFWLSGRTRRRQAQIRRTLPDVVDLLVVSVEAGLGLGSALAKAAEKMSGALPEEIARALAETAFGKPRTQALKDMSTRVGVGELKTFVAAVTQAELLGVAITQTLRAQSRTIRAARVQRVREQAARLPVTLLLPLSLFIFPAVFIVLLGPSLIRLYAAFSGMR